MELKDRPLVSGDMLEIKDYEIVGKLPDPFLFDDGHRMTSPDEWPTRRKELYRYTIELQYGTMPPENELLEVEPLYVSGEHSTYQINCGPKDHPVSFKFKLIMPPGVKNPPVIVDGDLCFGYAMDQEWLNAALSEGVAWALFDRTELAHDIMGEPRRTGQLFRAYPDRTFGALGAWAWGYSRVVDALEKIGRTDPNCVVFTGHSRGGKTACLAGALDERAVIVNPNETNAGSCSCYRTHMVGKCGSIEARSERLADLWHNFYYWLGPDMGLYAQNEAGLPFDCHEMKAMIAPRTLFVSEAAADMWTNQVGSWQTTMAAKEVYKYLGAEGELFWYYRPGTHYHTVEDVQMLVSLIKRRVDHGEGFDDSRFFHAPFDTSSVPAVFDWKAPEA